MKLAFAVFVLVALGITVFWWTKSRGAPISVLAPEAEAEAGPTNTLENVRSLSQERVAAAQSPVTNEVSPARTVRVVVRSHEGGRNNRKRIPDFAFALGVSLQGEFSRDYLLQAKTDAIGEYRAELELPSLEAGAHIFLRPLGPGYMQNVTWTKLRDSQQEYVIFLKLEEGCTVRGRVLNQAGEPEPEARVIFRFENPQQHPFHSGWFALTDSRGRFELHNRHVGRGFVRAQKSGVGNALIDEFSFIQACQQPTELELRLAGSGVLAGRVVTPDGGAVDQLTVEVRKLDNKLATATNETAHTGLGLVASQVRTDEMGEFRFEGLEPGTFGFWVHGGGYQWEKLNAPPVDTDREDIELVVHARRLELTLVEHDGTPTSRVGWFQSDGQSEYATIGCSWKQTTDLNPIWKAMNPDTHRGQTQLFPAKPGWSLRFAAFRLSGRSETQEVTFSENDWLIKRTLRLPPPRAPGTVAVTLESSDGGEFSFMVITVSDENGTQVHESRVSAEPSRSLVMPAAKLAAGRYTLTARAASAYRYDLAHADFEVDPAEHVELSLVAERGGRLELTVEAAEAPRDSELAALYAESATWGGGHIWPNIVGASLRDGNAQHPELSVHITDYDDQADWIPPGNTALVTRALGPGDHLIEVSYPGYIPVSVAVTIEVGKTAKATVELEPL